MENDRPVEPALVIQYLQQFMAAEVARYAAEISYRDAYIKGLNDRIEDLEKKLDGQG
jgi:hypothetical protein